MPQPWNFNTAQTEGEKQNVAGGAFSAFLNNFTTVYNRMKENEMEQAFKLAVLKRSEKGDFEKQMAEESRLETASKDNEYIPFTGALSAEAKSSYEKELMAVKQDPPFRPFQPGEQVITPESKQIPEGAIPAGRGVIYTTGKEGKAPVEAWVKAPPKPFAPKNPLDAAKYYQEEITNLTQSMLTEDPVRKVYIIINKLKDPAQIEKYTQLTSPKLQALLTKSTLKQHPDWIQIGQYAFDPVEVSAVATLTDLIKQRNRYRGQIGKVQSIETETSNTTIMDKAKALGIE